jgi:hypothetical protein
MLHGTKHALLCVNRDLHYNNTYCYQDIEISLMNHKIFAAAIALAACAASHASIIKIETATSTTGAQNNANAYKSAVETALQGASYASTYVMSYDHLTHAALFGGMQNFAWKATITFNVDSAANWAFRASPDFGRGGAIFLDGVGKDYFSGDFWDTSYSNPSQYLDFSVNQLAKGNHTLTIYGFENCCDGAQQAQFKIGNGQFTSFSNTDGHNAVPEPGTLALAGFGMAVMGVARRRRKNA